MPLQRVDFFTSKSPEAIKAGQGFVKRTRCTVDMNLGQRTVQPQDL